MANPTDDQYAVLGRFLKDCVEMVHEAGLDQDSPPDAMANAYIASWEKQTARIRELEADVLRLQFTVQRQQHHVLCSMTNRPAEECGLCQRLLKEHEIIADAAKSCIEYCAMTSQAIKKEIREEAMRAWKLFEPLKVE